MRREDALIVSRRFRSRAFESGLLVLAVALGVGAASAGFSLLANAVEAGKTMLASPDYREIIASARGDAEEMTSPALQKTTKSTAALTSAELAAAETASAVAYAYVRNFDEIRFVNLSSAAREQAMFASMGGAPGAPSGAAAGATAAAGDASASGSAVAQGSAAATSGAEARPSPPDGGPPEGFGPMTAEEIEKAKAEADIVIVEKERMNGFQVSPQFFSAWGMKAAYGSLFAEGEAESGTNMVILGSAAAASIAGAGAEASSLVGKRLLARGGYKTVVGILAPTGRSGYDDSFYSPYRSTVSSGPGGGPRFFGGNTQLRFTVSDPAKLASTESILAAWFAERYGEAQIVISNPRVEAQRLIDRNAGIGLLILLLSFSGLFIALVNVSNILLSRGLRMRRNVGILMALGASRSRIMGLFSAEAAAIAGMGSLLGAALSLPLSRTMQGALGLVSGVWGYALAGAAASCLLTLAFSVIPAWQSSRIEPAESMRAA